MSQATWLCAAIALESMLALSCRAHDGRMPKAATGSPPPVPGTATASATTEPGPASSMPGPTPPAPQAEVGPSLRLPERCSARVPIAPPERADAPVVVVLAPTAAALAELGSCDVTLAVEWATERVAAFGVSGTNTTFAVRGVRLEGSTAVITVDGKSYMSGQEHPEYWTWLVRVPGSATEARVEMNWSKEPWHGPLPP